MTRRLTQTDLDSPYLRMLLYGQAGSTKTRTSATAALDPRTSPALMLVAAGNPVSIRDFETKPDMVEVTDLAGFNDPYNWLAAGQPENHPYCKAMDLHPPYKTVIVDGLTEVQRYSFALVAGNTKVGPGTIPAAIEIQHFGRVLANMVRFAGLFFQLPMHVILTSLEREQQDSVSGLVSYGPLLWGQSGGEVAAYAYIVGRLVHRALLDHRTQKEVVAVAEDPITDKTVSVALFRPSGKYVAKDQTGALGPFMVDPTLTKILDKIERKDK